MNKSLLTKIAAGSVLAGVGSTAFAVNTLPAAVNTAFTNLNTSVTDMIDSAWPIAIAVTVGFIIIGLFKKAANKAV